MLCSITLQVEAMHGGAYDVFTGKAVHGFWLSTWRDCNPARGNWLHGGWMADLTRRPEISKSDYLPPFALSPLLHPDLTPYRVGEVFAPGARGVICLTSLQADLTRDLLCRGGWLEKIPERIGIYRTAWKMIGHTVTTQSYAALYDPSTLIKPASRWRLRFLTPLVLEEKLDAGGQMNTLAYPTPERLVEVLLQSWNLYAPQPITEPLAQAAREGLQITASELEEQTVELVYKGADGVPVKAPFSGWTGSLNLAGRADDAVHLGWDALFRFAAFRGIGRHTGQGLGVTRISRDIA